MERHIDRRRFLRNTAAAVSGLGLGLVQGCDSAGQKQIEPSLAMRKALVINEPTDEMLRKVKDAGFDGIEGPAVGVSEADKIRAVADKMNLRIHSVMFGWARFNSQNPDEVRQDIAKMTDAIHTARAYGADAVLLVPGRIKIDPTPQPWEFDIRFDHATGQLTSVVPGSNERYRQYIDAHNHAYKSFRVAIDRLVPAAQRAGVVIAVENVWNNLFVDPRHMAHFVDSFHSRHVQAYFDIGNHVKYSPPQDWIRILGLRIVKCHVKDFALNPNGQGGKFVNIRDGSVDWLVVLAALRRIGYNGWMTIEGSTKLSLEERSRRLDLIIAASTSA